jgi:hypothetical protein
MPTEKGLDQKPLRIGRIAFIAHAIAPIVRSSDFGPGHRALPRLFTNPRESQLAEITQLVFRSDTQRDHAAADDDRTVVRVAEIH